MSRVSEPPRIRFRGDMFESTRTVLAKVPRQPKVYPAETQGGEKLLLAEWPIPKISEERSVGRMILRIVRQIILVTMEPRSECLVTARSEAAYMGDTAFRVDVR